jgi:hypothetical protein
MEQSYNSGLIRSFERLKEMIKKELQNREDYQKYTLSL